MIHINLAHDAPDILASRLPVAEFVLGAPAESEPTGPFLYEVQLGAEITLLLDEWQAADLMTALQKTGLCV